MTRRSSPKGVQSNADTRGESVKFGHASALREPKRSAHMSTKTTKRKRAATAAVESPRPAPQALSTDVAATNTIVAADAAPVSTGDSLATSSPVSTGDSLATSSPVVSLFSNSTVKDAAALKGTLLQVLRRRRSRMVGRWVGGTAPDTFK